MPSLLSVPPKTMERRRSDGSLPSLANPLRRREAPSRSRSLALRPHAHVDHNLIEVLRRNYEIVTALADLDDHQHQQQNHQHHHQHHPQRSQRMRLLRRDSPQLLRCDESQRQKALSECDSASVSSQEAEVETSRWERIRRELKEFVDDVVDAFEEPKESIDVAGTDDAKLSVIALKKDLKRCFNAVHPYIEFVAALYDILMWKNPLTSLFLVLIYFYSIYMGWTASLILLLFIAQYGMNYLKATKDIDLGISFLPRKEVPEPRFDISGAQLILTIARIVQKLLRFSADVLEKITSLLTWREPRVSLVFGYLLVYWLFWASVFTIGTCIGWCAATFGIRLFFTTYLFDRFPKLRLRLDTYGWFYRNLPTKSSSTFFILNHDEDYNSRPQTPVMGEKFESRLGSNFDLDRSSIHAADPRYASNPCLTFSEQEDSSFEEDPMVDNVVAFRSCVINEKNLLFPKSISSGILYLTEAALVFRPKASNDNDTSVTVLFSDIISVKKIQSLRTMGLIAGTRQSIELIISYKKKPLQFIGVARRDAFLERLQEMCERSAATTYFFQ